MTPSITIACRGVSRTVLVALACLVLASCRQVATPAATEPRPGFLNQQPDVAYVGTEECRSCHLGIYSTYTQTGMGRSWAPMGEARLTEDFTTNNELVIPRSGLRYRMHQRDGKYYQRQFMLDSRGREIAVDERELVWAVGSNNHNRMYVTTWNGGLFQAPVCWYPQESKWELCPGYDLSNDYFSREISASCVFCHNGVMRPVEGARNRFEEPVPHGIGCERCHGPGQLHVERWSNATETRSGELDPTIVNPRRLSLDERLQICFQCHLGDAAATERVHRHGTELLDYRPGQRLSEIIVPFRLAEKTRYDFGLSAQADRMLLSRCYTESGGKMECLTCHNPHVTVYHEERPADLFRRKCLGCHVEEDCGEEHAARSATGTPDDCVACHMRRAEPDDLRFSTFTDHWIRKDIDLAVRDHRSGFDIEPVIPEDYAALPPGEQAYYRARASYLIGEDSAPAARAALWAEAEQSFRKAIDAGFDRPEARFFLAKTYMNQGRLDEALEWLQRTLELDPNHRDARFALGQAAAGLGDLQKARETFLSMLQSDPSDPMALAEFGRTSWSMGLFDEALQAYARAIEREPWNATLHLNLAGSLASVRRFDEAVEAGLMAARLKPESRDVWNFLMTAMREAGRAEDSREAQLLLERLTGARRTPSGAAGASVK